MRKTQLKSNPEKTRAWRQRSQKGLKSVNGLKQNKPMRKIGKIGKANIAANKKLKSVLGNIDFCEIGKLGWPEFFDCMNSWPLQNVHRHKRAWYKGNVELLSSYNQVVRGCQVCHDRIEHDAKLTERVFKKLRDVDDVIEVTNPTDVY